MTKTIKKSASFLFFICIVFSSTASGYLYRKLGVLSYSSLDQMTENYERFKKRIHPDNNSNSEESRQRFQELQEAYAVLIDPDRRAQYNQHLKKTQISEASNFYEVLGVLSNSLPEQIRRAYQELRPYIHPDRNNDNKESNERFKELQKAFRTLADPVLRFRHDTSLKKSYIIPHLKRVKETERNLREKVQEGQESAETAKTGIYERGTAELKFGTEDNKDDLETAIWNEQVFQLAKYLEGEGGEENIKEAISWYRRLAHENHLEAAWRLARLLEDRDIDEALYRYKQVQNLDTDGGDLARSSVFRQAQVYQTGVYKEKKALFPQDPKKASLLYEEAFRLGVPQQEIAAQYDRLQDYQKALEWQNRKNDKPSQQLTESTKNGGLMEMKFMIRSGKHLTDDILILDNKLSVRQTEVDIPDREKQSSKDLHLVIRHQDRYASLGEKQKAVVAMIRGVFSEKTDVNVWDGRGRTPLHLAIERWYLQVIELLLEMGADVNIQDADGNIALAKALRTWFSPRINEYFNARDKEMIQQILSSLIKKSDLSIRNVGGQKLPLYLAIRYRHPEAAVEIIQNGGAGSLTNEEYHELIQLAIGRGYIEVARLFREMLVNTVPAQFSQLHTAIIHYPEAAAELIQSGRIESLTKGEYRKLVRLAIQRGHENLVRLLIQASRREKSSQVKSQGFFSQFLDSCRNTFSK